MTAKSGWCIGPAGARIHRTSYIRGRFLPGLVIDHRCNQPACLRRYYAKKAA